MKAVIIITLILTAVYLLIKRSVKDEVSNEISEDEILILETIDESFTPEQLQSCWHKIVNFSNKIKDNPNRYDRVNSLMNYLDQKYRKVVI